MCATNSRRRRRNNKNTAGQRAVARKVFTSNRSSVEGIFVRCFLSHESSWPLCCQHMCVHCCALCTMHWQCFCPFHFIIKSKIYDLDSTGPYSSRMHLYGANWSTNTACVPSVCREISKLFAKVFFTTFCHISMPLVYCCVYLCATRIIVSHAGSMAVAITFANNVRQLQMVSCYTEMSHNSHSSRCICTIKSSWFVAWMLIHDSCGMLVQRLIASYHSHHPKSFSVRRQMAHTSATFISHDSVGSQIFRIHKNMFVAFSDCQTIGPTILSCI